MSFSADAKKENEQYVSSLTVFGAHIELDAGPTIVFCMGRSNRVRDPHHILFNGSIPRQFNASLITTLKAFTKRSLAETSDSLDSFRIGTCS
jgi:hypothetical protein